jgi:hypothetical protein
MTDHHAWAAELSMIDNPLELAELIDMAIDRYNQIAGVIPISTEISQSSQHLHTVELKGTFHSYSSHYATIFMSSTKIRADQPRLERGVPPWLR